MAIIWQNVPTFTPAFGDTIHEETEKLLDGEIEQSASGEQEDGGDGSDLVEGGTSPDGVIAKSAVALEQITDETLATVSRETGKRVNETDAGVVQERTSEDADNEAASNEGMDAADTAEPSGYSLRLIVRLPEGGLPREGDLVLGVRNGAYLIGFDNPDDLEEAKAYYGERAEWHADDCVVGMADGEEPPEGDPTPVGEDDNAFAFLEAIEKQEAADDNSVSDGLQESEEDKESVEEILNPQRPLIALIDTGAPEGFELEGAVSVVGDDVKDVNGHATRMLEAILAEDGQARVLSIKALEDDGTGSASNIYAAIEYAIEAKVDVINLSLAGRATEGNAAIAEAVKHSLENNIVVVAAAGNGGYDAKDFTPAGVEGVLTVGAASADGEVNPNSNRGDCVDLYVVADFTSVAAARVAGWLSANGVADDWRDALLASDLIAQGQPIEDGRVSEDQDVPSDQVSVAANIIGTSGSFDYTGGQQSFTANTTGWYYLQAWGAQGGGLKGAGDTVLGRNRYDTTIGVSNAGGEGGYSEGFYYLNAGSTIYVYVGQWGNDSNKTNYWSESYNGGGASSGTASGKGYCGGAGGGMTHFSTSSNAVATKSSWSNASSTLIAAGGGGGSDDGVGPINTGRIARGGYGGGEEGGNGARQTTDQPSGIAAVPTGGKQNAAGDKWAGHGYGGSSNCFNGSGGGGWYGGGTRTANSVYLSGAGGSGYVGGTGVVGGITIRGSYNVNNTGSVPVTGASITGISKSGSGSSTKWNKTYSGTEAGHAGNGNAKAAFMEPYEITLDNQSATTAGTTKLYEATWVGYFTSSVCNTSTQITVGGLSSTNKSMTGLTSSQAIVIPTKSDEIFAGYWTRPNGPAGGGELVITPSGYMAGAYETKFFQASTTLYAFWQSPREITSGTDYPGRTTTDGAWSAPFETVRRSFTAPADGWYKYQAWGAQGGGVKSNSGTVSNKYNLNPTAANQKGGRGGYAEGYEYLTAGTRRYIYTGQWGNDSLKEGSYWESSYNGGGASGVQGSFCGGAGGGMTHFSTLAGNEAVSGEAWDPSGALLVAGGGGGSDSGINLLNNRIVKGGVGGGANGGDGAIQGSSRGRVALAGTQVSGSGSGFQGVGASTPSTANGGGGGGWWGGGVARVAANGAAAATPYFSGAGGSGYYSATLLRGSTTIGTSSFDAPVLANTNSNTVSGTEVGHPGNGYALVTQMKKYEIELVDAGGLTYSGATGGSGHVYEVYGVDVLLDETLGTSAMSNLSNPVSVPVLAEYTFAGYYSDVDANGNGTGTRLINNAGYRTASFTNTYYPDTRTTFKAYAKWVHNAYALLTDSNDTTYGPGHLFFFRHDDPLTNNTDYTNLTLTYADGTTKTVSGRVWTGVESSNYTLLAAVPWLNWTSCPRTDITSVEVISNDSPIAPVSTAHWLDGCTSLVDVDVQYLDTSPTRTTQYMFRNCISLNTLDISSMDTVSSTTAMGWMFTNCTSLRYIKLGEDFSFKGNGSTVLTSSLKASGTYPFTGNWIGPSTNITPIDSGALTYNSGSGSGSLASTYNGTTMAGWYQWEPRFVLPVTGGADIGTIVGWVAAVAVVGAVAVVIRRKVNIAGSSNPGGTER